MLDGNCGVGAVVAGELFPEWNCARGRMLKRVRGWCLRVDFGCFPEV
ncbi:MAG: hypothetical protein ACK5YO_30570 [Planctomyces sp.]